MHITHHLDGHLKPLAVDNTTDVQSLDLQGVDAIALNFPKFSDGRAYSQAYWLRRRLNFKGELIATGDVLVDELQHMQRCGFSLAVLRADQDLATGRHLLALFDRFYQGDAAHPAPHFVATEAVA